jgi:hypothetical protein
MTDEQMQPLLKAWFRARSAGPADVSVGVAQVVARLPETRQRSRWWPLPVPARPAPTPVTNGRQPARGTTMFSALKSVFAGIIVALLGGLVFAGILAPQQAEEALPATVTEARTAEPSVEPTEASTTSVRSDLLPGVSLTVDEVRPGIYRVLSDGQRDLRSGIRDVVVDAEGAVWIERGKTRDWRILRLGDPGVSRSLHRQDPWDLDVTADGRPSIDSASAYRVFDGEAWAKSRRPNAAPDKDQGPCGLVGYPFNGGHMFPVDGACWNAWSGRLQRWDDGEWQEVPNAEFGVPDDSITLEGGDLSTGDDTGWAAFVDDADRVTFRGILGHDAGGWKAWAPYEPGDASEVALHNTAVGPDGTTVWMWGSSVEGSVAISWDGEAWTTYGPIDMSAYGGGRGWVRTYFAPDGTPWFGGAAVLWQDSLLPVGLSADSMVFASDGTAWFTTSGTDDELESGGQLYVITPEAMAAAE